MGNGFLAVIASIALKNALITLVIASFAGAQSSGPTEEEAAKNRARPYFEGLEALKRYRESEECENSDSRTVLAELKELEELITSFRLVIDVLGADVKYEQYALEARKRHASLAFEFAEEALERGCFDAAGGVYRRLIVFYTGSRYPKILEHARLEIRRIRLRQANEPSAAPLSETNPKTDEFVVPVTIINKRYVEADPTNGTDQNFLWWDSFYDFAHLKKKARAVKGELEVRDLFGEPMFMINVTITDEILPGGDHVSKGVGLDYNQFEDSHRWMRTTKVKDMQVVFRVKRVIYADGGREQYK